MELGDVRPWHLLQVIIRSQKPAVGMIAVANEKDMLALDVVSIMVGPISSASSSATKQACNLLEAFLHKTSACMAEGRVKCSVH